MSAAFVLPMISAQIRGNRSDEEMGAARGGVEDALNFSPQALVVIKSTIPVGHTKLLQELSKQLSLQKK